MKLEILNFVIPILTILAGVWAKYSSEPKAKRLWWILIVLGLVHLTLSLLNFEY